MYIQKCFIVSRKCISGAILDGYVWKVIFDLLILDMDIRKGSGWENLEDSVFEWFQTWKYREVSVYAFFVCFWFDSILWLGTWWGLEDEDILM